MRHPFFTLLLSSLALVSCHKDGLDPEDTILDFCFTQYNSATKSSSVISDSQIGSASIIIYNEDGNLVGQPISWEHEPVKVRLNRRESYHFCAICNPSSAPFTAPPTMEQLRQMTLAYSFDGGRVVMAGQSGLVKVSKGMGQIAVRVERVASRITLRMDKSLIPPSVSFQIKSVRICGANSQCQPFGNGFRAAAVQDGDQLGASDISTFNGGVECTLYVPENMQGCVPAITDPADKLPSSLPAQMAGLCTYMEIVASVKPAPELEAPADIVYRFFLGGNKTDSFDIGRNMAYRITFQPHNSFYNKNGWKMRSPFVSAGIDGDGEGSGTDIEIDY